MRIRPFCVFAILTWGFTWGAGQAAAQGYPAYAPNGYPPPGYGMPYGPPPGYGMPMGPLPGYFAPPPGMPIQGMPMQGMPMQGMPMQGMPMQGVPMQGMPMQGVPMQATPVAPAFPGFAPYAGSQTTLVPTTPSTPVPAQPTGNAVAGDSKTPAGSSSGAPAAAAGKGEKIPAPVAPPIPDATPPIAGATPLVSEPMISFINGMPPGYLQSYNGSDDPDHGPGCRVPQRVCNDHCWFSMSYVMGFIKPGTTPIPLVTTANAVPPGPGALGNPLTAIAFGNRLSFPMQSGVRLNFGGFLDNSGCYSLEGDLLYFVPVYIHSANQSDALGNPLIARPFFDVSGSPLVPPPTPGQHAFDFSVPGAFAGGTSINAKSELYGFEVNGRRYWNLGPNWRADALLGFRYLHLDEHLIFQDNSSNLPGSTLTFLGLPASGTETDFDSFATRNNFYGGQIGGRLRWQQDWLFATSYAKLALGGMVQQAIINGGTTLFSAGTVQTTRGGLLALPSNIGNFKRTMFGVVPEFGATIGINVTPNLQLFGGYSFLLMNTVLRPGGQIDNHVNVANVPASPAFAPGTGPAAPLFHFNGELFWINMLNVGLNWHF